MKWRLAYIFLFIPVLLLVLSSCSVSRFVPSGHYMLNDVKIVSDSVNLQTSGLYGFVRQHPNSKWFSLFKVPMLPYMLSTTDSTRLNRFLWRIGEAPVVEDSIMTERCAKDISAAVRNMGYLDAEVETQRVIHKHKVDVRFRVNPRCRYTVGLLEREINDSAIAVLLATHEDESLLYEGMPLDMNVLDAERSRIHSLIVNNGYYQFNKEFIRFEADTTEVPLEAWLRMVVDPYRNSRTPQPRNHTKFRVDSVKYNFLSPSSTLRRGILDRSTHISAGSPYREKDVQATYSAFGSLAVVLSTTIRMEEDQQDSTILHPVISITTNKPNSVTAELEGTNSAGDLGAAVALSFQNCNLFNGSEVLGFKIRGAYESVRGLAGYDDHDFIEYSMEASLKFPYFALPFLSKEFKQQSRATSELAFMFDSQDRPEFHRRVLSGAWRYRWNGSNRKFRHRIDLIDLNYVYMPWISETFKHDYLDDPSSRNAILRYNYENLFIMRLGYNLNFTSLPYGQTSSYGTNAYSLRLGVETAGNLLRAFSMLSSAQKHGEDDYYKVFNIAYAQYAKFDIDYAKSFRFDNRNSLAMHFALGVAVPYGNSRILPYEKRYFSGGANSVRGWSVRSLGPGSFRGSDGRIDFINQTGDVKLDLNLEYRTHLFWKIDGAAFIDAGNIWTLRNYEEQPGGQFRFSTFWKQLAASYGIGLRLNFNFFILRFDAAMKAVDPSAVEGEHHFPIVHPLFKRDFAFHFAVGLPF